MIPLEMSASLIVCLNIIGLKNADQVQPDKSDELRSPSSLKAIIIQIAICSVDVFIRFKVELNQSRCPRRDNCSNVEILRCFNE
jgi:hypothetical protein